MKQKTIFVCNECGYEAAKWYGKCPGCGEWNTMTEQSPETSVLPSKNKAARSSGKVFEAVNLNTFTASEEDRISCDIKEFDRVLGGGFVSGSLLLLSGDPGVGKSTLLLQMCKTLAEKSKVLYVSGEESAHQIKLRANRLGISASNLHLLTLTNTEDIEASILAANCDFVIIDSIQTMYLPYLQSAPGSVSQVRECAMHFLNIAKFNNITVILVGHVTKDGSIAGPRVLEHMVDCVLYFEGEGSRSYRILRAVKNRYGSTNEIGVFEMTQEGLAEIANPSATILSGRPSGVSGTCIACIMEGTRPILAEVQALVTPTSFGMPRRACTGFEYGRAAMLIAVLEKRCRLALGSQDIYINVTGGLKLDDTAADAAVAMAIASSFLDKPLDDKLVLIGEVGLAGEVRAVSYVEKRIMEAKKLGFEHVLVPSSSKVSQTSQEGIFKARNIKQAISLLL